MSTDVHPNETTAQISPDLWAEYQMALEKLSSWQKYTELLREKIVAQASRRVVIVIDESKLSPALGITLFVPTIVIPVSGVLMSIVCLMDIVRDCRQIATGESHDPRDAPPPIDYTA